MTTGGGFTVGLIRWLTKFPDKLKTLYTDIQAGHVEYEFMPVTLLLCMISLCCGATLGPELGLVCIIYKQLFIFIMFISFIYFC